MKIFEKNNQIPLATSGKAKKLINILYKLLKFRITLNYFLKTYTLDY